METINPQVLYDAMPAGMILLDAKFRITYANGKAVSLLGSGQKELIGMPFQKVLPASNLISDLLKPEQGSGPVESLIKIVDQGQETALAVTCLPLASVPAGDWMVMLHDTGVLQAVPQTQNNFLANITHEFRTPLSALKASVELILESLDEVSPVELERLLKSIHYSVAGLQTLIDNLLESASIESGSFRINSGEAKLSDVIAEAVHVMSPLLQRREQGLQIEMDWSLPPIAMDPMRITQVVVNLLSNASKYSPTATGIRIRVESSTGEAIKVSVIDQGAGLTLSEQRKLFHRYVRLSDRVGEQFGVGLGLSVVKTIVEAHGGTVGVEANPEGGSIFWFTLPAQGQTRELP
jgi:K+-sensing histidine kinase KdpD